MPYTRSRGSDVSSGKKPLPGVDIRSRMGREAIGPAGPPLKPARARIRYIATGMSAKLTSRIAASTRATGACVRTSWYSLNW